jgi:hypothetical protein
VKAIPRPRYLTALGRCCVVNGAQLLVAAFERHAVIGVSTSSFFLRLPARSGMAHICRIPGQRVVADELGE